MAKEERPVRALRFTGFLGIWGWPLVNLLLERLGTARLRSIGGSSKIAYSNIETYEIFEDKAGVIRMKVHRRAERN